jgi:hypothetical protein
VVNPRARHVGALALAQAPHFDLVAVLELPILVHVPGEQLGRFARVARNLGGAFPPLVVDQPLSLEEGVLGIGELGGALPLELVERRW